MKQDKLVAALRIYGGSHTQMTRDFANSLGVHATDAAALSEIIYAEDRGSPISPAVLAKNLGISKPALSACLNRLELAEHVTRFHDSQDRRTVTLRCNPRIYEKVGKFFGPISKNMEVAVKKLSKSDIEMIEEFLLAASKAVNSR